MKKNAFRSMLLLVVGFLAAISLRGCGWSADSRDTDPVTITIAYTGVDAARDYLLHVRERFPDLSIELISNDSSVATIRETDGLLVYLSEHLSVADITISNGLNQELPRLTESFADLSGKDYSANYQTSYLNDVAIDGSVYYFPFYLTVKGLICNKSLFDEKGWQLPGSYEEFCALLETISRNPEGITPLYDEQSLSTVPYWMSVYYALNEGAVLSGYEALQEFNRTLSVSGIKLSNTLSYMSLLAKAGCLSEEALDQAEEAASNDYYSLGRRETAMAFGSGMTWTVLKNRGFQDEFVMLPMYSPDCPEGYVLEQQSLNIGVSKAAMDNPEKEAAIDALMRYITSEMGQQKLLEYSSGIKSPCYGIMNVESRKFMEGILPALQKGYIVQAVDFPPVEDSFDHVVVEYLFQNDDRHLSEREVLAALERSAQLQYTALLEDEKPVAAVAHDLTHQESAYHLLNAMAEETGADFAVLPKTQGNNYYGAASLSTVFRASLLSGPLTGKNIRSLIVWDTPLHVYPVTGDELLKLMDYNTSVLMIYGAQMEYTYDRDRETYRTTGAILPDGSRISPSDTYTLVTSAVVSLSGQPDPPKVKADILLSDALIAYCRRKETLSPPPIPEPQYIK